MRKPLGTVTMKVWMATVTVQSVLLTGVVLGLLFPPTSLTTALKLNGTTTTSTAAPGVNLVGAPSTEPEISTTVASFLQPEISETTLSPQHVLNQVDELTTTTQHNLSPSSPLAKRHSSVLGSDSRNDSPQFIQNLSSSSAERVAKPQRNGIGTSTTGAAAADEDGEQSLSLSTSAGQTSAEELTEDDDENTTGRHENDSVGGGVSASTNSLGNSEADSLSSDKDESDTYFSAGDDDAGDSNNGGGEVGDTIFPPEENGDKVDSDESDGATTFASLVRPFPTINPQQLLTSKLSKNGSGRIGTRGLNSKSALNAISQTNLPNNPTNNTYLSGDSNDTKSDANSGNIQHDSAGEVTIDSSLNKSGDRSNANGNINNSSSSVELNGSSFFSRSTANTQHPTIHPLRQDSQAQHHLRTRPTSPVINYNSNNHNNNLHNRIIKRKRISLGRDAQANRTSGSSLSSIYGNSILTSSTTLSSTSEQEEGTAKNPGEVATATAVNNSTVADSLLHSTAALDATTESNSLLNASHEKHSESQQDSQDQQSSPPSTSGGEESDEKSSSSQKNLTTPVTPAEFYAATSSSNNSGGNDDSNSSAQLSSSRAILGFGSSLLANHGKVKRPKPIILRDRNDESLNVNNISENAAGGTTSENGSYNAGTIIPLVSSNQAGFAGEAGGGGLVTDETATLSVPPSNEEDNSRPVVASNALPTPPFKVKRVKLTSRRPFSTTPQPSTDELLVTSGAPGGSLDALLQNGSYHHRLNAAAASGATDYRPMQSAMIRPSSVTSDWRPIFSSRRVTKEEFGITRNSYTSDADHVDEDDADLQGTTDQYLPPDSATPPYPIPLGVRQAPIESVDNGEDLLGRNHHGKIDLHSHTHHLRNTAGGGSNNNNNGNRYRDYYSEGRLSTTGSNYGSGGGNLHSQSVSHLDDYDYSSVSPVTVTVTHTVVRTTPLIMPTATFEIGDDSDRFSRFGLNVAHHDRPNRDSDEGSVHPNLEPTPTLPSSISTGQTTAPSFETGQGPAIHASPSVENAQVTTRRQSVHSVGLHSTRFEDLDDSGDDESRGNDQMHKQEQNVQHNDNHPPQDYASSSSAHQPIQPTPVITTKGMKSVYFTQVNHPHFSSSSYEFTTSSMYSYTFPDHDSMSMSQDEEDDHTEHHEDHTHEEHPSSPQAEHSPEVNSDGTTTTTNADFTTSPATPPFWDDLGNLTRSSSSQVPITTMDLENGGVAATPTIDIDIYPPIGLEPTSKVEDATTQSPTTTTRPPGSYADAVTTTSQPGSIEDNDLSDEELRKQQSIESTTTMQPSSPSGVDIADSDKTNSNEQFISGGHHGETNSNGGAHTDDHQKTKDSSGEGGAPNNFESGGNKKDTTSKTDNDITPDGMKTPFGIGDTFGIGQVHVPLLIQMDLDLGQAVFCSHVTNFKTMIVTVYNKSQRVESDQVVLYTEKGCELENTSSNPNSTDQDDSKGGITSSPRKPGASTTGKIFSSTTKGTVPLTSPPSTRSPDGSEDDESRKSRSGKDFSGAKNLTSSGDSSSTLGKSIDEGSIDGNKSRQSAAGENAPQNKSITRSRRSTKMASAPTASKNISGGDIKSVDNMSSSVREGDSLLSVYFYLADKNGSYDQDLTASFVTLWNESRLISNNTNGGDTAAGGNGGSFTNNSDVLLQRVKKVSMITASHLVSTTGSSDENSGIIIAITVASVVAVCLFLLGVGLLIMRHRQSQTKFAKRCTPVTLDDYSLDNISVYNSFRRKQRLRGSKRSYTNAAFDDPNAPSRPMNASALATALTEVPALESEFRAIPNVTATLDDIPNGAETKNRYANVIPMPDTRVLLTFQEDVPNSDYINANYVRGVNGELKRYIITQGPMEETIVEFWRMVWEQQVRVIFMLTDFNEGGIAKCAEYYPRSETIDCSQLHGDFQITLEKRDISDNCITSYLVLKDMERNLRRDIIHFWYHSWPDKGVPTSPKKTIDFLNRSRKFTKEPTPVLVHCSPGTGRSGTIVACDIGMKEYDAHNKVDIPRIILKIRQDRAGAVQTKEQYVHIYEVLHSYTSRIGATQLESI